MCAWSARPRGGNHWCIVCVRAGGAHVAGTEVIEMPGDGAEDRSTAR
jgi:hypothetical protein